MIYITKKSQNISQIQVEKCDWFICYEAKTTPTVKCHRWLNIISPYIQQPTKMFHEKKIYISNIAYTYHLQVTIISTDLIEK